MPTLPSHSATRGLPLIHVFQASSKSQIGDLRVAICQEFAYCSSMALRGRDLLNQFVLSVNGQHPVVFQTWLQRSTLLKADCFVRLYLTSIIVDESNRPSSVSIFACCNLPVCLFVLVIGSTSFNHFTSEVRPTAVRIRMPESLGSGVQCRCVQAASKFVFVEKQEAHVTFGVLGQNGRYEVRVIPRS